MPKREATKQLRPLYLKLSTEDRTLLDKIAVAQGVAAGRPVRIIEVVRGLVRNAAKELA
jgi:hypothetical protein